MKNTPNQPLKHILEDDEDDYVEVTGVDEDVEDGWEEVMVVNSPTSRKVGNIIPIHPTTNTIITTTTTTNNVLPQQIITTNIINNNNVITNKAQEVLIVEKVYSTPVSMPKEIPNVVPQDPEWLTFLKANKVPYSAPVNGDPEYVAPYGEPYARTTLGLPYASPQEGGQYLDYVSSTVSYVTSTTVIAKEQQNDNEPPYCVAYH